MQPNRPRIACILDEFSFASFSTGCTLLNLPAEGWQAAIENFAPSLLLVESAFFGHQKQWHGLVAHADRTPDNPLRALFGYCNDNNIPTVFWNKDDPVRFADFIGAASLADHVLSTDINMLERYREQTDARSVGVMPFATHLLDDDENVDAGDGATHKRVCFPGSWYRRYPQRGRDLKVLLAAARPFGLDILDRNADHPNRRQVAFPLLYRRFVIGSAPADSMTSVFRRYPVILNVNTVTDSSTMVSRRVLDATACGACILSNPSEGLTGLFGPGVIPAAGSKRIASRILKDLLGNREQRDDVVARAQDVIRARHQITHRIEQLAHVAGIAHP